VPLIAGDHVTDDAGTGFVHTAPGHGREDFEAWMDAARDLEARGISSAIPFTVDDAGYYTKDAPGLGPDREGGAARVIDDKGKKGDANQAVITALIEAGNLFARGRLKHDYPHSWRSKKPIIFRNTPQWFVHMDKDFGDGTTLRSRALKGIDDTRFVPASGQNRLRGMIEDRPDWVLSRQRAWGVPICVFADADGNVLVDEAVNARILEAFETEGADAWFAEGARERFLGNSPAIRNGSRSPTFSMSGSIRAVPMSLRSKTARTSNGRPMSISKAPTSTAAGSIPRCSKAAHARPRAL
jgi:isoleucyl-tRNA synthetase